MNALYKLGLLVLALILRSESASGQSAIVDSVSINWSVWSVLPSSVHDFATQDEMLYAATDFGLFVSSDGGAQWERHMSVPAVRIEGVVADDSVIVAVYSRVAYTYLAQSTETQVEVGVYTSRNHGNSFEHSLLSDNVSTGSDEDEFAFFGLWADGSGNFYAQYMIDQGAILDPTFNFFSDDEAETWQTISGTVFIDMAFSGGTKFGLTSANPTMLMAASEADFSDFTMANTPSSVGLFDWNGLLYRSDVGKLYRSASLGATWDTISIPGLTGVFTEVQSMSSTVAFGLTTDGMLWRFAMPNFTSMTQISVPELSYSGDLAAMLVRPGKLLAAVDDGPVMASATLGVSWTLSNTGLDGGRKASIYNTNPLVARDVQTGQLLVMEQAPGWTYSSAFMLATASDYGSQGGNLYGINGIHIWKSNDAGQSWDVNFTATTTLQGIENQNGSIVAWSLFQILYSNGSAWSSMNTIFPVQRVVKQGNVFLAISGNKIYRSDDFGQNWEQVLTNTINFQEIITTTTKVVAFDRNNTTWVSTNTGETFVVTGTNLSSNGNYWSRLLFADDNLLVALRYFNDTTLLLPNDSTGHLIISDNDGGSWLKVNGLPDDVPIGRGSIMKRSNLLILNGQHTLWQCDYNAALATMDCNLTHQYEVSCSDNNTPNDSLDDTYLIELSVSGGFGETYLADLFGNTPATYGQTTSIEGLIADGPITVQVAGGTEQCTASFQIVPPAPCSVPPPADSTDLQLSWVATGNLPVYQPNILTLTLENVGDPDDSIVVYVTLPVGLGYLGGSDLTLFTNSNDSVYAWEVGQLGTNGTISIEVPVIRNSYSPLFAYAQVVSSTLPDVDSEAGNGNCCLSYEDDETVIDFAELEPPSPDSIDLQLTWLMPEGAFLIGDTTVFQLFLNSTGIIDAEDVAVEIILPNNVAFLSDLVQDPIITLNPDTLIWLVPNGWGQPGVLSVNIPVVRLNTDSIVVYAQVVSAGAPDIDSQVDNGTCCTANEDDEAAGLVSSYEPIGPCNISAQITQVICLNDETPTPSDDLITLQVIVNGENAGTDYVACNYLTAQSDGTIMCDTASGPFGIVTYWGAYPATIAAGYEISIYSADYPECQTSIVIPDTMCSTPLPEPDLTLSVSSVAYDPEIYTYFNVWVTVVNEGDSASTGIEVAVPKPNGVVFQGSGSHVATQGIYAPYSTQKWQVGTLQPGESAVLTLHYFLLTSQPITQYAQVIAMSGTDTDSSPNNGSCCTANEDDESIAVYNYQPTEVTDISLSFSGDETVPNYSYTTLTLTAKNESTAPATSIKILITTPSGYTYQGSNPYDASTGTFNPYSSSQIWEIPAIPAGDSATLELHLFSLSTNPATAYAQVSDIFQEDFDSQPANGACCSPGEDDETVFHINGTTGQQGPDLWLMVTSPSVIGLYEEGDINVRIKNNGNVTATGIVVNVQRPEETIYIGGNEYGATKGNYDPYGAENWTVSSLEPGEEALLSLHLFITSTAQQVVYAQVQNASPADIDSSPGNGVCCTSNEDDEDNAWFNNSQVGSPGNQLIAPEPDHIVTGIETLYPNPATGDAIFIGTRSSHETHARIILYDMFGRPCATRDITIANGYQEHELDIRSIPSGVFVLRIIYANNATSELSLLRLP